MNLDSEDWMELRGSLDQTIKYLARHGLSEACNELIGVREALAGYFEDNLFKIQDPQNGLQSDTTIAF